MQIHTCTVGNRIKKFFYHFRIIFPYRPKLLGLYSIAAGVIAEALQLVEIDKILGVEGTVLGIILGSTFDAKDVLCYVIGGLLFFALELLLRKKKST